MWGMGHELDLHLLVRLNDGLCLNLGEMAVGKKQNTDMAESRRRRFLDDHEHAFRKGK